MEQKMMDYLFDLQGYLVLENTISVEDLSEMNQWIDDHWEYVEQPWLPESDNRLRDRFRWIGNIQTHTYNIENGVNFQNIIEAKFIGLNEKGEARIEIENNEKIFNSGIIEL